MRELLRDERWTPNLDGCFRARGRRRIRRAGHERGSDDYVAPAERIAVFDNDGTLWCEKPMPIELDFILERLAEMAAADASLRDRQPWKAAYAKDYALARRGDDASTTKAMTPR